MKPKHSGNVPASPAEKLIDTIPSGTPKAGPAGIQPPKQATQNKKGVKCYEDGHSKKGGRKASY